MNYPPLLAFQSTAEYRAHYENLYCRGPVVTFDGIEVRFGKKDFNHCFFESVVQKDDTFSPKRAERMEWIRAALQDHAAQLYVGWDNKRKVLAADRRVAVVMGNYVVIIQMTDTTGMPTKARFVTAYVADSSRTLQMITSGPRWAGPKNKNTADSPGGLSGKPF